MFLPSFLFFFFFSSHIFFRERIDQEGMKNLYCIDKLPSFLAFLFHDLLLICSFFISHPLILAYFLLLFPYLLKLFFLLYPLIFSTFLLLLAILTSISSEFHVTTSSAILNFLRSKLVADEGKVCLTEQLCAMFFVDSQLYSYQMDPNHYREENLSEKTPLKEEDSNTKKHGRRTSEILQRDGSMRKEKEWKRTLACKLFEERMTYKLCEERQVVDGAEEMDLLWEAYEVDANKTDKQRKEKDIKKAVKEKVVDKETEEEDDDDDEEEDDDDKEKWMSGKLCCLQALKLSAGKMNLGVRRPSLVKVSMALKGMSVFHREGRRRRITI